MINITEFNTICSELVSTVTALKGFVLVAEDQHATKKLKDKREIQLVAVIPSADRSGQPGRAINSNVALFFVLEKMKTDATDAQELDQYQRTQAVVLAVQQYIEQRQENGCSQFFRLKPDSIQINPEYNTFGGWNGWSLQLIF